MTIQQLRDVYINNRSTYCSTDTILKYTDDLDLFFQRQIVKDFLIKFTKKVPEAPYGS